MKPTYENPLCTRYASRQMQQIFSPDHKFTTWRRLWIALAESERALGLPITQEQIDEMRAHVDEIDYEAAAAYEKRLRHDVMAHIHAFGDQCPKAMPIIHLGATSCFVGDNTDVILMREALRRVRLLLLHLLDALAAFAGENKNTPTLAWTHFQAAQPTTLGKRACLWAQDLLMDLDRLDFELGRLRLLGCKGTTGTGASFLALFGGDAQKVLQLERLIAQKMDFDGCMPVSGQTYSRKVDSFVLDVLSGIAQSAAKMATDLRLLAHLKELDEPFESEQVGSSAMAYKRNPMRCERICSLARHVCSLTVDTAFTASCQWLERTLDDSANRRISIPEAFLSVDALLTLAVNVIRGCRVYPKVMEKHLREELPFIATENILMHAVAAGGDRQALHEAIRRHSVAAAAQVKLEGRDNDLLDRLLADERFGLTRGDLDRILQLHQYVGLAPEQTEQFLDQWVRPVLAAAGTLPPLDSQIRV